MAYNYNVNGNGRTKNSVINKHKGEIIMCKDFEGNLSMI